MPIDYKHTYRKNLPHIQPPGATFFITTRLAGSLPRTVVDNLKREADEREKQIRATATPEAQHQLLYEAQKRQFGQYDALLDKSGYGPLWLQEPEIAQLVKGSLHYLDNRLCELVVYTIMGNHVHVVLTPLEDGEGGYISLARILHSFKSYTAGEANKLLKRSGQFWQHESYDHVVRDEGELARIRRYVLQNPVKAGLVVKASDWPYSWARDNET